MFDYNYFAMNVLVDDNISELFNVVKKCLDSFSNFLENGVTLPAINSITLVFYVIVILWAFSIYSFIKEFIKWIGKNKRDFSNLVKNILPETAFMLFFWGMTIYYIGYAYQGSGANFLTLVIRSALSSFEMFLSKSNLIGIASNCKSDSLYMFMFAFVHAVAVMVSMVFAVTCFGKRVRDWVRLIFWRYSSKKTKVNIFWGFNEKSITLAKDIYLNSDGNDRIIFIDFPDDDENTKTGQSFSGIIGLLTYKTSAAKQLSHIGYLIMKSSVSPLSIDVSTKGILDEMGIGKLGKIMDKAEMVNCFALTDNESFNIQISLNLLDSELGKKINNMYCTARRTKEIAIHEECWIKGKLHILDDSKEAVIELAMRKNVNGDFYTHPINYVSVNPEMGYVETSFNSLIIGFGTTGQDAFRFLYEFSAFPDANKKKSDVKFYICDANINAIIGNLCQEIPALKQLESNGEIEFCQYNSASMEFYEKLHSIIDQLNYVVIATGNDEQNLDIAARIYEFAMQYRKDEFCRFRIFVRMYNSKNEYIFRKTAKAYSELHTDAVEYFGSPNDIYTKRRIIDDEEIKFSERFYKAYCEVSGSKYLCYSDRREEEVANGETKLLGYRRLNRVLLQDKANSKHCYTKEKLLGLNNMLVRPLLPEWPIGVSGDIADDEKMWRTRLLNVSICEHLRWNASHLMMGYVRMTNGKSGSSCDERMKQHLCLVDWDELPGQSDYREYDYMVVKTSVNLYYELKR